MGKPGRAAPGHYAFKVASFLVPLAIWGWASTPIHEGFHLLAATALHVPGHISLTWYGVGQFSFDAPLSHTARILVGLAGGVGTGALFLALWLFAQLKVRYTMWALPDAAAFLTVGALHLAYSPMDALGWYEPWSMALQGASTLLLLGAVFGLRLWAWWTEDV